MKAQRLWAAAVGALVLGAGFGLGVLFGMGGDRTGTPQKKGPKPDTAAEYVQQKEVPATRPEQKLSKHDRSDVFNPDKAMASSPELKAQPEKGEMPGFDFARDPLGAERPKELPQEMMKADLAMKPKVMALQRR